jgi:hypothetical protein
MKFKLLIWLKEKANTDCFEVEFLLWTNISLNLLSLHEIIDFVKWLICAASLIERSLVLMPTVQFFSDLHDIKNNTTPCSRNIVVAQWSWLFI